MTLDKAMHYSELSEEEVKALPCSWRSYFGNSFAVWKCTELDKAVAAKAAEKERALVEKYGAEKLRQMRAEEAAAKAKQAADERAAVAAAATVREMSELMVDVYSKLSAAGAEPTFPFDDIVPNAQAKKLFGLTDAELRGLSNKGPLGRSKSSFALDDVLRVCKSKGTYASSTYSTLPVSFLALKQQKQAHPTLVERSMQTALSAAKAQADAKEEAAVAARSTADTALQAYKSLQVYLSGAQSSSSSGKPTPAASATPAAASSAKRPAAAAELVTNAPAKAPKAANA